MINRFVDLKVNLERVLLRTNPFIKNKKFFSQKLPPTITKQVRLLP